MSTFPSPTTGASLLIAFKPLSRAFLVVGSNELAATRAFTALEAGAIVIIAAATPLEKACKEIIWRVQHDQLQYFQLGPDQTSSFSSLLDDSSLDIALACVTDTLLVSNISRRSHGSASLLRDACRKRGISINVSDMPDLCDFTFPSTHRFVQKKSGLPSSLQVAVTTNGRGCRLAGRIRRDLISKLHPECGDAVEAVGKLRSLAKESDSIPGFGSTTPIPAEQDEETNSAPLNTPVPQLSSETIEGPVERAVRRMRWVNQVSEYWPLDHLAALDENGMRSLLHTQNSTPSSREGTPSHFSDMTSSTSRCCPRSRSQNDQNNARSYDRSQHGLTVSPERSSRGQILLVGSGPGHPSMLTVAARKALTELGTRVLSDKLVPAEILALIPAHIPLYIAKKFPGNADGAQSELMEMAVEGAKKGETIVRLKQGDPMLYGRGGEEVLYFRSHGFESVVIPGVSSSLAAPCFAGIPVTQRGVSESLTICTGVGRKGKEVELPGYERSRTLVILMGVARLAQVVAALTDVGSDGQSRAHGPGKPYPPHLPIAIIERASSPDQRMVASTLDGIERALERAGEQRPPGMIVVGWVVLALEGTGDLSVLEDTSEGALPEDADSLDTARIKRWLGDERSSIVREGLSPEWGQFL